MGAAVSSITSSPGRDRPASRGAVIDLLVRSRDSLMLLGLILVFFGFWAVAIAWFVETFAAASP